MKKANSAWLAVALASAAVVIATPVASAQQGSEPVGQVKTVEGPAGSVLIIRDNVTYTLQPGDSLFPGDRVFTRTNGIVEVSYYQCAAQLAGAQSIDIQPDCAVGVVALAETASVGGVAIGAAAGGIGATPLLLTTAAVGAGAAVLANDDPSTP